MVIWVRAARFGTCVCVWGGGVGGISVVMGSSWVLGAGVLWKCQCPWEVGLCGVFCCCARGLVGVVRSFMLFGVIFGSPIFIFVQ